MSLQKLAIGQTKVFGYRGQHGYQREITVYCNKCKEWMNESDVKTIDIAEDMQGRDELTFKCPACKTTQKSIRRG